MVSFMSSMQKGIRQQGQHPTRQRITVIKNCRLKIWKFQTVKKVLSGPFIDANQDFLCKLGIKLLMHLVDIIIFLLYHVIIRPTKIIKDLRKDCKIPKSIFSNKNPSDLSEFFSLNNVGLGDQLLIMKCFEIFDFENVPNFCRLP